MLTKSNLPLRALSTYEELFSSPQPSANFFMAAHYRHQPLSNFFHDGIFPSPSFQSIFSWCHSHITKIQCVQLNIPVEPLPWVTSITYLLVWIISNKWKNHQIFYAIYVSIKSQFVYLIQIGCTMAQSLYARRAKNCDWTKI